MTRKDLKEWIQQETSHCKTHAEVMDEIVRFIVTNFKLRKQITVVETKPLKEKGK